MQYFGEVPQCARIVDMFLPVFYVLDVARKYSNTSIGFGPDGSQVFLGYTPKYTELFDGCPMMILRITYTCHDTLLHFTTILPIMCLTAKQ